MLTPCKIYALNSLSNQSFEQFVEQIIQLKDSNSREAYLYLHKNINEADKLTLENRLVYYKYLAETYSEQAYYQQSKDLASKALNLAQSLSSPSIVSSELYYTRGFAIESLGDFNGALRDYQNGLEIAESLNDQKFIAMGLVNLGAIYYLTARFDRALIVLNQALNIARVIKDNELLGYIYSEMGILYSNLYEEDKSMEFYQKSYEYYQKAGKIFYAYNSMRNIAISHADHGRHEESIKVNKQIIEHAEEIGNTEIMTAVYSSMAWSHLKKADKNPEAAYVYMKIGEQYAQQSEQNQIFLTYGINKAFILLEMNKYDEALEAALTVAPYLQDDNTLLSKNAKLDILYLKSQLYYIKNHFKEAYQAQEQYLDYAFKLREQSNYKAVEDLRMRYESEQADLQKQLLDQQQSLQTIRLKDTEFQETNRNIILIFSLAIVIVIGWFLFKLLRGQRQLVALSRTDGLTGVVNRRRLIELSDFFFHQAKHEKMMLSVLMIDIDDFKLINDTYGHKIGDKVLKKVAKIGANVMRSTDEFGRFGGEEFIALLPDADLTHAIVIAERICHNIFSYKWNKLIKTGISVSIGVASVDLKLHSNADDLIKSADILLYKAKSQGKNQVCA